MTQTFLLHFSKSFFKYYAIAKVNWKNTQAFLLNTLAKSLIVVLRIAIFYQVYTVTFQYNHLATVNGMDVEMVIWSLVFAQSFQTATRPPVSLAIQEEIQSGALAYSINRPYSFILFQLFSRFGTFILNTAMNVVLVTIIALLMMGIPTHITLAGALSGLLLSLGGFILDFLMNMVIGLFAFWLEDIRAINWIYTKGLLVLGGLIIPISLFPDGLKKIVELLPFPFLFAGAAQLIVHFQIETLIHFAIMQTLWILIFALISKMLFSYAIKYVSHNGG